MKKFLLALCIATLVGCKTPNDPPIVVPITNVIHESDSGKLFSVNKGANISIELPVANNNDFYWSVDGAATVGGLSLVSETEIGNIVRFIVQADSSGVMTINYQQFTDVGGKVLKTFLLKVEVK